MEESALTRTFDMLVERLTALESTAEQMVAGLNGLTAGQEQLLKAAALNAQRGVYVLPESGVHRTFTNAIAGERTFPSVSVSWYTGEDDDGPVQQFRPHPTTSVFFTRPEFELSPQDTAEITKRARAVVDDPAAPGGVRSIHICISDEYYPGMLEIRMKRGGQLAVWWDEWLDIAWRMVDGVQGVGPMDDAHVLIDPGHYPDEWLIQVHSTLHV
jgi:hypothetical protein